jgi:DNA-directed RNA polymerase specialized sigma24 family protein
MSSLREYLYWRVTDLLEAQELVARSDQSDDIEAAVSANQKFQHSYERLLRILGRIISARTGLSPEETELRAMDVFIKFLQAELGEHNAATCRAWLWTAARNARIDALRHAAVVQRHEGTLPQHEGGEPPEVVDESPTPEEQVLLAAESEKLIALKDRIHNRLVQRSHSKSLDRKRWLFEQRVVEGTSYEEMHRIAPPGWISPETLDNTLQQGARRYYLALCELLEEAETGGTSDLGDDELEVLHRLIAGWQTRGSTRG